MPKPVWLDKSTVMKKLDRSERTVENLATDGKIETREFSESGYTKRMYLESSVKAYKAARDNPTIVPVTRPSRTALALPAPAAPAPAPEEEEEDSRPFDALPGSVRLTLREAARYLRVPLPWLRAAIADGRLPYDDVMDGRQAIRVLKRDLDALEAAHCGQ
jgi:excisionase family DNA binding protein